MTERSEVVDTTPGYWHYEFWSGYLFGITFESHNQFQLNFGGVYFEHRLNHNILTYIKDSIQWATHHIKYSPNAAINFIVVLLH